MKEAVIKKYLNLNFKRDEHTLLPYLQEQDSILQLIMTYLSLPYSVAEYGCGKKTSIIIQKLVELGIPFYAIKRGMIMEKDMSDASLWESDYRKRDQPLVIKNPLYETVNFDDPSLLHMLLGEGVIVDKVKGLIRAENFILSHDEYLQFIEARSHIFPIVSFWDPDSNQLVERAIDPTVNNHGVFPVEEMRNSLGAKEAFIFDCPLFGNFRMNSAYMTAHQKSLFHESCDFDSPEDMSLPDHNVCVKKMLGASSKSIGDPYTWTYANNISNTEIAYGARLKETTGNGEPLRTLLQKLIQSRIEGDNAQIKNIRKEIEALAKDVDVKKLIAEDSRWAENKMQPLTVLANTISAHGSLNFIAELEDKGKNIFSLLEDEDINDKLLGIGVKLRERIEKIATASRNEEDEIDARALNDQFINAAIETIMQMNNAGMTVFIDQVGNIHGLLVDEKTSIAVQHDRALLRDLCRQSICHCSHIDTVKDAGKYDGRLGVLSGIQVAQVMQYLSRYFEKETVYPQCAHPLMVSCFIGEEMTFTGHEIAMPGSAAVAGYASVSQIHEMKNITGDRFGDKLGNFIKHLKVAVNQGRIELANNFKGVNVQNNLVDCCYQPDVFFSPYTYERQIEQGYYLDQQDVPFVLTDTIMGIEQQDILLHGNRALPAAFYINKELRKIVLSDQFEGMRSTVGFIKRSGSETMFAEDTFCINCTIYGQKNHSGAAVIFNRRDPGVALARLYEKAEQIVSRINENDSKSFRLTAGDVLIKPGHNRNVIPSEANSTLAISGESLSEDQKQSIIEELIAYLNGPLSKPVPKGGEGITSFLVNQCKNVLVPESIQMSLDIRYDGDISFESFKDLLRGVFDEAADKYGVRLQNEVKQTLKPIHLNETGQVLQIERSFGGSHNPQEVELSRDMIRGSILQIGLTRAFVNGGLSHDQNLYDFANRHLPELWKQRIDHYTSAALHDTCNIARKVYDNQPPERLAL